MKKAAPVWGGLFNLKSQIPFLYRTNRIAARRRRVELEPFLKWAGGKRWLAKRRPDLFKGYSGRLIEPFLGSGAIFFATEPKCALLSDTNAELVNVYEQVRDAPRQIYRQLEKLDAIHCEDLYYKIRSRVPITDRAKAVRFLYLNRTCFNGIYRVNRRDEFNVPIGSKTDVTLATDDFEQTSNVLKAAELVCADFQQLVTRATQGDLLFLDPPYTSQKSMGQFTKYNSKVFSWEDQVRLHKLVSAAANRGAKVVMTNFNHSSLATLYRNFKVEEIERKVVISGTRTSKNGNELLITS